MSKVLLKKVILIEPGSKYHNKTVDILINNSKIEKLAPDINSKGAKEHHFSKNNAYVSPGWMDMYASFCDPGYEYKEDISTGLKAAESGGFTAVAVMPYTKPCTQSKSEIEYLIKKASGNLVSLYPFGAITKDREGKELTEMADMHESGAVGFSDGLKPQEQSGLILRALQYVKQFNGVVLDYPEDSYLSEHSMMHEGDTSTNLGLKGIPDIAESLAVYRNIALTSYTNSRLHFAHLSSASGVRLVKKAKRDGLNISASVSSFHLLFDDTSLKDFDANFKVRPVLRANTDRKALIRGLLDGTIDAVCSNHMPHDKESKDIEFDYAESGIINLETSFSLCRMALSADFDPNNVYDMLVNNPRRILGIKVPKLMSGAVANLTVFDPDHKWIYSKDNKKSKSSNTPLLGAELTGKPLYVYNNGKGKSLINI